MTSPARSLPLEGRVAAQRPGGVIAAARDLFRARNLTDAPPPGRTSSGHPPLQGEAAATP